MSVLKSKRGTSEVAFLDVARRLEAYTSEDGAPPDKAPSLWEKVGELSEGVPEWAPPVSALDAYRSGDRVVHGGERWVSEVNENVWTPGAYGWNKQQEE